MNLFKKTPLINEDELISYIQEHINSNENKVISKDIIELILDYELKYLQSIDIATK